MCILLFADMALCQTDHTGIWIGGSFPSHCYTVWSFNLGVSIIQLGIRQIYPVAFSKLASHSAIVRFWIDSSDYSLNCSQLPYTVVLVWLLKSSWLCIWPKTLASLFKQSEVKLDLLAHIFACFQSETWISLWALIGSNQVLYCLCPFWLARVITLILVL